MKNDEVYKCIMLLAVTRKLDKLKLKSDSQRFDLLMG